MDTPDLLSLVILGVAGLIFFLSGQFLERRKKLIFSLIGVTLVLLFAFKLLSVYSDTEIAYTSRSSYSFKFYREDAYIALMTLNILAFIFWLIATFTIVFSTAIPGYMQRTILIISGIIILSNLVVYYCFTMSVAASICPIMGIGFFISCQYLKYKMRAR